MPDDTGEHLTTEGLNFITKQALNGFGLIFSGNLDTAEAFPDGLQVEILTSAMPEYRFPAVIGRGPTEGKIFFDTTQYDEIVDQINLIPGLTSEDVARLYLGASIPLEILTKNIRPQEFNKIHRLYTVMSNSDAIALAVRCSGFTEPDQADQLLSLMQSDEQRICRINSLRFAIGSLFIAERSRGNSEYADKLQESFRRSMHETLAGRESYLKLLQGITDDEIRAEGMFAEQVSEIELAICFPMREQEIKMILEICAESESEIPASGEIVVGDGDLAQGFTVRRD